MAVARYLHTATLLPDGQVLVAGGTGSSELATASTEVYDPTTGGWSSGDSMSVPREDHTATLLARRQGPRRRRRTRATPNG